MATNGRNGKSTARRIARRTGHTAPRSRGVSLLIKLAMGIMIVGFLSLIGLLIAGLAVYKSYTDGLVAPDELAINQPSYGARILDRNGKLLYEYVDDHSGLRRPVHLGDISDAFLATTISTEDDSFFTNPGVNLNGLLRAGWANLSPLANKDAYNGGGSSITEQLVKNVYIPEQDRQKRLISRKIKETIYALELTNRYSKDQILEWYVNQIAYGGVYNGVEAASQGYFGKPAKDLTLGEAALLAGIPQSPSAYDPVNNPDSAVARRNEVLDLMERQGGHIEIGKDRFFDVSIEQIEAAKKEELNIAVKRFPIQAPHFVLEYVQPQLEQMFGHDALYRDGLVVTTTLDIDMEDKAHGIMEAKIAQNEKATGDHNGSLVIVDPKTGEILTMVGSRDYFREDIQGKVNNAVALNSPGSSFKPFVYMMAFQRLGWGPGTLALDTPVSFKQADGTEFSPTNPTHTYSGPVTLRNALGNSLNVVAEKVAAATGIDYIVQQSKKFGFTTVTGSYGPAIATGGIDLTQVDMAFSYQLFANGGVENGQTPLAPHRNGERTIDPISILEVTDAKGRVRWDVAQHRISQRIVAEEYPYLVTDILTDGSSQCITFGCGGITVPGYKVAVKTGTSQPFDPKGPNGDKVGETWAFGYTPDIIVSIWTGNSDNSPINLSLLSTTVAYPVMKDTLLAWYDGRPETPFHKPEGVVSQAVCVPSGMLPSPLCGKQTTDIFARQSLPKEQDNWWRNIAIDGRTNLLAGPATPFPYIVQKTMLVFPPDLLKTDEERKSAQEWANALGIALAPTDTSPANGLLPGDLGPVGLGGVNGVGGIGAPGGVGNLGAPVNSTLPAIILSPASGESVGTQVPITGIASSPNFRAYRLEFGSGLGPSNWTPISLSNTPVPSGTLGTWNTADLPPGIYTIRLIVLDLQRGQIAATVSVNVGAGAGGR